MKDVQFIKQRLQEIYLEIKEIIDLSADVRNSSVENKKVIAQIWEQFLNNVFSYIKQKSKETGQNLLWGISFLRMR